MYIKSRRIATTFQYQIKFDLKARWKHRGKQGHDVSQR